MPLNRVPKSLLIVIFFILQSTFFHTRLLSLLLVPALSYLAHHSWACLNPASRSLPSAFLLTSNIPNNRSSDLRKLRRLYFRHKFLKPGCCAKSLLDSRQSILIWHMYFEQILFCKFSWAKSHFLKHWALIQSTNSFDPPYIYIYNSLVCLFVKQLNWSGSTFARDLTWPLGRFMDA